MMMETLLQMPLLVLMARGKGKGYASLNGIVAAICNGKSVDGEVMSKVCKSCQYWEMEKKLSRI